MIYEKKSDYGPVQFDTIDGDYHIKVHILECWIES